MRVVIRVRKFRQAVHLRPVAQHALWFPKCFKHAPYPSQDVRAELNFRSLTTMEKRGCPDVKLDLIKI